MPLRGENVGTAYVRILADGSGLGKSIKDQFDDDDTFGSVGEKKASEFTDGFEKDMEKEPTRRRLREAITGPIARGKWLQEEFFKPGGSFDAFKTSLRTQYGKAGERAGEELTRGLMSGKISLADLDKELDNILPRVLKHEEAINKERADADLKARKEMIAKGAAMAMDAERDLHQHLMDLDRQFEEDVARLHADALQIQSDRDRDFEQEAQRLHDETMKARMDADKQFELAHAAAIRKATEAERQRIELERAYAMNSAHDERMKQRDIKITTQRYKDLIFQIERMARGEKIEGFGFFEGSEARKALAKELDAVANEMTRLGINTKETHYALRDHERDLHMMHPLLNKVNYQVDRMADGVGKAFGKGSRNDFINFIGVVSGGIAGLIGLIPDAIMMLDNFRKRASFAAKDKGFAGYLGSMAKDIFKLGGTIGAALGGAYLVVGPLLSIITQLAGVVVALASNLGFSLVGALGAAGGAVLPLIAGLGVAAFGFANLEGAAKKSAKGVVDAFKDLGKDAAAGLTSTQRAGKDLRFDTHTFEQQMNLIRGMVSSLGPLTQKVGSSMGYAIDIFIDRIGGTEGPLAKFIDSLDGSDKRIGWLATNARIAGRVLTETFGGLLGMLRALEPAGHDALDWLRDITTRFNDWINDAQGQNAVKDFMDDSLVSLKEFWNFLDATWDLFRTLLAGGKDAGDSLFGSMADNIDDWTKTLKDNPDILKNYFDDAKSFGRELGHLLESLGKVADALDNEFSRSLSTGAIELFADAIGTVADVLREIADVLGISENKFLSFSGQVGAAALVLPRLSNALLGTKLQTTGLVSGLRNVETRAATMQTAVRGLAGAAGIGLLIDSLHRGDTAFGAFERIAGGAAAGFAVGGPIGAAVGALAGGFLALSKKEQTAGEKAREMYVQLKQTNTTKAAIANLDDLKETLDQVTGAYTGATRAAVLQKLQQAQLVGTANDFGISTRTLINAAMGQKGAMEQLWPVIGKVEGKINDLKNRESELAAQRRDLVATRDDGATDPVVRANIQKTIDAIDEESASLVENRKKLETNLNTLRLMPGELRKQGREVRQTAADTADYSGLLHGIPQDVRTYINNVGMTASIKDWAKVAAKIDDVDRKQIKTLIEATGDTATKAKIDAVMRKLGLLDAQKPTPKLNLDDVHFRSLLSAADRDLVAMNSKVATPKIHVESDAQSAAQATTQWLNSIQDEWVYINLQRRGGRAPITATGGVFQDQVRRIGESGREAVVPLQRPLGEVDPSVRWLSAVAQGKAVPTGSGKTVDVGGLTIVTPSEDPHAVATEVINQLVGSGY